MPTSCGRQHLVEARFFDVQDLALQRKDRLGPSVAALLRGAAGGVALDEEQLRQSRILLLAVGELPGQTREVERAFAAGHLARLACGFARARGLDNFRDDGARILRALEQKLAAAARQPLTPRWPLLRRTQLVLRLRREFRICQLYRQDCRESFARIVTGRGDFLVSSRGLLLDVVVERARQRAAKASQMRTAVLLRNVVGVAEHALLVGIVPLHRDFHDVRHLARCGRRRCSRESTCDFGSDT